MWLGCELVRDHLVVVLSTLGVGFWGLIWLAHLIVLLLRWVATTDDKLSTLASDEKGV
jgi:hypothetical protein